jgi:hypothetical protein
MAEPRTESNPQAWLEASIASGLLQFHVRNLQQAVSEKMDLAFVSNALIGLIQVHGSWMIAVVVALESAGVPLPGETILVAAALLAATSNQIDIAVVVAAAATGAIIGDGIGYTIGRHSSALRPAPVILPKVPLFSRA